MKKSISVIASICLLSVANLAFALDYAQHLDNKATFETLKEAHANGPAYLGPATGRTYMPDPALDSYPDGTTYVYRSARMFTCLSAANRMNTNILVYADKGFEGKDAALAYLKKLGLTEIVDKACGSVVLVSPIDKKAGYGAADQYAYYQMQSAMFNIGYTKKIDDKTTAYYADSAYFGGLTYRYLVGIDGGATFLNNYVASTFDYVSRVAGMLLINGDMDRIQRVASFVPAYLVNAPAEVVEKYKAANATDALEVRGDVSCYYDQSQPLKRVYVAGQGQADPAAAVKAAYYGMFVKALRNASVKAGLHTASTPYADYKWNMAPYSLSERNAILDGATADGLFVTEHKENRFSAMATPAGNYVQTWFEVLPKEVKDNTAPARTVPLILANHGAGDDPVQFLDEMDWLSIAGKERLAIVAPYHTVDFGVNGYNILCDVLPALVKYMLAKYPALDPSRVYVTGYSMGGGATNRAICSAPRLFAAAVPQAALAYAATPAQAAQFDSCDIPVLLTTSTYDAFIVGDKAIADASANVLFDYQAMINQYLAFNGMKTIKYDFSAYRYFGAKADVFIQNTLNDEYANRMWLMLNDKGVPMVGLSVTDFLPHGLYQEYGKIAWNFMKHYARDQKTGAIVYDPFVD